MKEAVAIVKKTIDNNLNAVIIVDCDVDGYTSSAILINFI